MDVAAIEEEIGGNIGKGDQVRNFEAIRHGRAHFQALI